MWYFSWILGVGLACTFGILNAIWYEFRVSALDGSAPVRTTIDVIGAKRDSGVAGDGASIHTELAGSRHQVIL